MWPFKDKKVEKAVVVSTITPKPDLYEIKKQLLGSIISDELVFQAGISYSYQYWNGKARDGYLSVTWATNPIMHDGIEYFIGVTVYNDYPRILFCKEKLNGKQTIEQHGENMSKYLGYSEECQFLLKNFDQIQDCLKEIAKVLEDKLQEAKKKELCQEKCLEELQKKVQKT
jgi:hypothetical protein